MNARQRRFVVGVAVIAASVFAFAWPAIAQPQLVGKVVAIQDGDTLTILDPEDVAHRVRIAGIDAPERAQPFGYVATVQLSALAFGRLVIADCPKTDRYGREVCTIWSDGRDVGLALVSAGLAWHFKRYQDEQSPDEREAYSSAEDHAREARIGLWQDTQPIPPWEWRALRRQ